MLGFARPALAQQAPVAAADPPAGHHGAAAQQHGGSGKATAPNALPPVPADLPAWMDNKRADHLFYKRGPYNFDIYNVTAARPDLNAVAVGHSMAYETWSRARRIVWKPTRSSGSTGC
jgi:hypothetical protein